MKKLMKMVLGAWCLVLGAEAARASDLPEGYTPVECIVAPAGSYIDTGYKPNQNTRVVMDVTVQGTTECWFGCWDRNYNDGAFAFGNDGGGIYAGYGNQGGTFGSVVGNGRHTVELDGKKVKVDGKDYHSFSDESFTLENNLYLFAQNRAGTAVWHESQASVVCYGCTISEGGSVKRSFVPCIRESNGIVGLYDTVEGLFYGNGRAGRLVSALPLGRVLTSGDYYFPTSFFLVAPAGESALKVAEGATVTLNIPFGVELTLRGGDANGVTGAGAGLEVPESAKVVITGAGKLNATGGNAANGANGEQGTTPASYDSSSEKSTAASGGRGGNGGGGAGAGIGGRGGKGGAGGAGGASFTDRWDKYQQSGNPGGKGSAGDAGASCGVVEIGGLVTVIAAGGTAGANGSGGDKQDWCPNTGKTYYWAAYGSGGGGGGGGGLSASDIGGGGAGGGGAGGGGGGGLSYSGKSSAYNLISYKKNGLGGAGGHGVGSSVGGKGKDRADELVTYDGTTVRTETKYDDDENHYSGGGGGTGGAAGTKGDDGTLLLGATVKVRGVVVRRSDSDYIIWKDNTLHHVTDGNFSNSEPFDFEVVDGNTATIGDGKWYVVKDTIERGMITVSGTANLVLVDGGSLTVNGENGLEGIWVPEECALNIFGEDGGRVTATGDNGAAGIGGRPNTDGLYESTRTCGDITINGGTVTATGGGSAAGIGGSNRRSGGRVTINGGIVTATGGDWAAGVGGGNSGAGGKVTINGGTVTAQGGIEAAGIGGGGRNGAGGEVTINGGTVTATGGQFGTFIGGSLILGSRVIKIDDNHYRERLTMPDEVVVTMRIPSYLRLISAVDEYGAMFQISKQSGDVSFSATAVFPRTTLTFGFAEPGYRFTGSNVITVGSFDESVTLSSEVLPQVKSVKLSFAVPDSMRLISVVADDGTPVATATNGVITSVASYPGSRMIATFAPVDVGCRCTNGGVISVGPIEDDVALSASDLPRVEKDLIAGTVEYLLPDGSTAGASGVVRVNHADSRQSILSSGWYMVEGQMTTSTLNVQGEVNLILADGAMLTVNGGVRVDDGNEFTVYGQREGTGELVANGAADCCAGIGGQNPKCWAGYGGCGTVIINGGEVTAQGGVYGAGIGGGYEGAGGTVTINGGTVTATGGYDGAGIGGGYKGAGGEVTINGGTVTATGGYKAAGIGGGSGGAGGTVTVSGGIFGMTVNDNWCPDGYGVFVNPDADTKGSYPYAVLPAVTMTVGALELVTAAWTSGDGSVTNVVNGETFKVPKGARNVKVIFTIDPSGELVSGDLIRSFESVDADVEVLELPQVRHRAVEYVDADGKVQTNDTFSIVTAATDTLETGWYIVECALERGTITVNGSANLIIMDDASLTVTNVDSNMAAIEVTESSRLTIYGQKKGSGRLSATGDYGAAGIGGGYMGAGGTVIINGGSVTARGGYGGAGIGSGYNGVGGSVTINGGTVTAQGDYGAAGIGSGYKGSCGTVTINGGTVAAQGSDQAAGIGSGYLGSCEAVSLGDNMGVVEGALGSGNGYVKIETIIDVWKAEVETFDQNWYVVAPRSTYINTHFKPDSNTRVTMDVKVQGKSEYWFGCWDGNWDDRVFALGNDRTTLGDEHFPIYRFTVYCGYGSGATCGGIMGQIPAGRVTVALEKGVVYTNDKVWSEAHKSDAAFALDRSLYLFAQNRKGAMGVGDLQESIVCYGCRISTNDVNGVAVPVRNFVPARTKDERQIVGLYDTVSGDFFAPRGGTLTLGHDEGAEILITPGMPLVFDTAEEATNAMKTAMFAPSAEVAAMFGWDEEAKAEYCAKFGFAVLPTSGGQWAVVAGLKPEAWSNVVESAQAATRQIPVADIAALELGVPTDVTVEGCVPGFYYTIYGGSTATNLKAFVSEKSRNVLCEPGKPVKFSEVVKPSDAAGFFSIGVMDAPFVTGANSDFVANHAVKMAGGLYLEGEAEDRIVEIRGIDTWIIGNTAGESSDAW